MSTETDMAAPAVLPTADAPTAETLKVIQDELAYLSRERSKVAKEQASIGKADVAERWARHYQAVADGLSWLSTRLPSLLAADADRQRMDWLEDRIVEACGRRFPVVNPNESGGFVYLETWGADDLRTIIDAARSSSPTTAAE